MISEPDKLKEKKYDLSILTDRQDLFPDVMCGSRGIDMNRCGCNKESYEDLRVRWWTLQRKKLIFSNFIERWSRADRSDGAPTISMDFAKSELMKLELEECNLKAQLSSSEN